MDTSRRGFIKQAGLLATVVPVAPHFLHAQADGLGGFGTSLLKTLTEINDSLIEELLSRQVALPGDRWHGGVMDVYEVINTHSTAWFFIRLANSYASKESRYYLSQSLEEPMRKAAACLVNVQHEDGTIDLHSTNFHSTPDTAFLVNYIKEYK